MEVADSIVVLANGRVEQSGRPDELYERPANDFVMSFLGPVTTLGGELVRPHDLEVLVQPAQDTVPATVLRVVRLGFEVRVEVLLDGVETWAQVTRTTAARLGLQSGSTVYVRPERVSADSDSLVASA